MIADWLNFITNALMCPITCKLDVPIQSVMSNDLCSRSYEVAIMGCGGQPCLSNLSLDLKKEIKYVVKISCSPLGCKYN